MKIFGKRKRRKPTANTTKILSLINAKCYVVHDITKYEVCIFNQKTSYRIEPIAVRCNLTHKKCQNTQTHTHHTYTYVYLNILYEQALI